MSNAAALEGEEYAYFVWGVTDDAHEIKGTTFNYYQDVKNEPLEHYLARQIVPVEALPEIIYSHWCNKEDSR